MLYHIYNTVIVPYCIFIPLAIGLFNYKFLNIPLNIFLLFIGFSTVVELVTITLARHNIPNLFIFHIYTIFEFAFISMFYRTQFNGIIKKAIPPLVVVFGLVCLYNFYFVQSGIQFNTYTRPVEAIIIIMYCALLFSKQDRFESTASWGSQSLNWINIGLLVYYSCSFFTFIFSNYLLSYSKHVNNIVWGTYDAVLILENILFAIGFYKCRKQPTISSY